KNLCTSISTVKSQQKQEILNKEKERMKEQEKAARERESRYNNSHLFTSITVSGTTLCSACSKSITAKEALSCLTCNVTIHNRCRDTLPNCTKMKQKQQKIALIRNNSALQNVTLRTKRMHERPSSAIYPSNSFQQSQLGSRRGRSSLTLSKSVSTNNIAGTINDDSPLGLRRILSQSTESLSFRARVMSVESLTDEGDIFYTSLFEEIKFEGQDFKADSWSMAVDNSYLQTHCKNVIKRQDVIYELIQTELHHVRTLHIMERVFRQGMLEELQLDPNTVHSVFPCLDQLTRIHSYFLRQLLLRCNNSLQSGSSHNYTIHQLGDILLEQFSGQCADDMRKTYSEFCSRHMKAVKLYKDLLARDKRFQGFIRRVGRGPLLRCHGVQECILLVTQRISKYPVLVQRILDNTTGESHQSQWLYYLSTYFLLYLNHICMSLQIRKRLMRDGGLFKTGELLRRRLIHEGTLLWKTPGSRLKDTQVLLMTDILVFLQEKDQRYSFPSGLTNPFFDKPPVLSLQNLIVRDIANHERGMFFISDSSPPEMYEFHAASKEDKSLWMCNIQHAVSRCPSREEFPLIETEHKAHLRRLKADLKQKDREMLELLQERVTLFCELAELTTGQEGLQPPITRYLFRADTPQAPCAEKLLLDATAEADRLSELLLGSSMDIPLLCHHNHMEVKETGESLQTSLSHTRQDFLNCQMHHILQAAVVKQDSILELLMQSQDAVTTAAGRVWCSLWRDGGNREAGAGSTHGELALLQRQHSLLKEEMLRLRDAESQLKESGKTQTRLERHIQHTKVYSHALGLHFFFLVAVLTPSQQERDASARTVTPQANQDSVRIYQSHSLQESSDLEVDMTSDDEDGTAFKSSKGQITDNIVDILL
uniref:Rho guanine nucleotide exchange factor (GEF) 1a n=1 Tax=Mola mola TaxID=94237 RepID=A0A3Q3WTT2_MOLML